MSVNFGPQFFNKNNIPPKREVKPNEASELQGAESQNAPVYKENETTDHKKPTPKPLTDTTVVEKWGYRFIITRTDGKITDFEVEKLK